MFIYAPFEEKVRRLRLEEKSEEEAIELVETVDLDRAAFIKQHFGIEWPARHFFHLMVNAIVGEEAAVQTIVNGLAAVQERKSVAPNGNSSEP